MYLLGIKQVMSEFEEYITLMSYMHQDYEELWRDRLPPKQDKLCYFNVYDVLEKAQSIVAHYANEHYVSTEIEQMLQPELQSVFGSDEKLT